MSGIENFKQVNSRKSNTKRMEKNIRYLRKKAGLTLKDLAELLGYKTPSLVGKWETGLAVPTVGTLMNLSLIFGVSMDAIMTEDLSDRRRKAIRTTARAPLPVRDDKGRIRKACPCCRKPLDENGNDGRFCKYCGQEIDGKKGYGDDISPFKTRVEIEEEKKKKEFDWDKLYSSGR